MVGAGETSCQLEMLSAYLRRAPIWRVRLLHSNERVASTRFQNGVREQIPGRITVHTSSTPKSARPGAAGDPPRRTRFKGPNGGQSNRNLCNIGPWALWPGYSNYFEIVLEAALVIVVLYPLSICHTPEQIRQRRERAFGLLCHSVLSQT